MLVVDPGRRPEAAHALLQRRDDGALKNRLAKTNRFIKCPLRQFEQSTTKERCAPNTISVNAKDF